MICQFRAPTMVCTNNDMYLQISELVMVEWLITVKNGAPTMVCTNKCVWASQE